MIVDADKYSYSLHIPSFHLNVDMEMNRFNSALKDTQVKAFMNFMFKAFMFKAFTIKA